MESLSTFWLSVLLFVLLLASAFFSASETSMMALNRYRLKTLSSKNNLQAQRVERLLKNIDYRNKIFFEEVIKAASVGSPDMDHKLSFLYHNGVSNLAILTLNVVYVCIQ